MSKEITNVSIEILKVHPRNTEFFDDISGKDYENFKHSIKEEGIISEIIVAPDMTIISGHQRYKAAKELGISMVPVRIREDLIDENKKLKILLAANFGRTKNDDRKQRKVADEYVRLCGYKNGEMGNGRKKECQVGTPTDKLTLEEIASQLGTSKRDLQRALRIERNLTEEMKELLDTGVISKTFAADIIASLSPEEQKELLSSIDTTEKITKKEMEKYIKQLKETEQELSKYKDAQSSYRKRVSELLQENNRLETQLSSIQKPETIIEIQEKEIDRPETLQKMQELQDKLDTKTNEAQKMAKMIMEQEKMINQAIGTSTNYQLTSHCSEITLKMLDFVKDMSKYDYMAESFNEIPIATRIEYEKCIKAVKKWADRILDIITEEKDIVEDIEWN